VGFKTSANVSAVDVRGARQPTSNIQNAAVTTWGLKKEARQL